MMDGEEWRRLVNLVICQPRQPQQTRAPLFGEAGASRNDAPEGLHGLAPPRQPNDDISSPRLGRVSDEGDVRRESRCDQIENSDTRRGVVGREIAMTTVCGCTTSPWYSIDCSTVSIRTKSGVVDS